MRRAERAGHWIWGFGLKAIERAKALTFSRGGMVVVLCGADTRSRDEIVKSGNLRFAELILGHVRRTSRTSDPCISNTNRYTSRLAHEQPHVERDRLVSRYPDLFVTSQLQYCFCNQPRIGENAQNTAQGQPRQ